MIILLEPFRAWRHRRRLRELDLEQARVVRARNDAVHRIMAIRYSAEREMHCVAKDADVIEGTGYWEDE